MVIINHIPIRYKVLLVSLILTTTVVSAITFTMSALFHDDKKGYIHDLISTVALHTAEETGALLRSYQERLNVFARIMADKDIERKTKVSYLENLFAEFPELVSIMLMDGKKEPVSLFDSQTLEAVDMEPAQFKNFVESYPLPKELILAGKTHIRNSTISEKLPTFLMANMFRLPDGDQVIVVGFIRIERLYNISKRAQVYDVHILDNENNILTHENSMLTKRGKLRLDIPDLVNIRNQLSLGGTKEYMINGIEMIGGFAGIGVGDLLAIIQVPKSTAFLTARALFKYLLWVTFAVLVATVLVSLLWSFRLTKPIERLTDASSQVAKGEFDIKVDINSNDEIGKLANSFNNMSVELKEREDKLKHAHAALVQSEKMSAFGQMSAGIAHEVKNPLTGILGHAQLSKRKLDADDPLVRHLDIIEKETKRCTEIINNLMKFARSEKTQYEPISVNEAVESAIDLVDHQLSINRITIHKSFAEGIPQVIGNSNQIEQVVMNLMINAQQAMKGEEGEVWVSTQYDDNGVEISVRDNGPGIPAEIRDKIFEPFFTTKKAGEGTGLGLSVSYGIIQDHQGSISINSSPGEGTEFVITLPIADIQQQPKNDQLTGT